MDRLIDRFHGPSYGGFSYPGREIPLLRDSATVSLTCSREVHDLCVLLGYGADAICPYLVFETLSMLRKEGKLTPFMNDQDIYLSYIAAVARGISKVMAKMGISTLQSYKVTLHYPFLCLTSVIEQFAGNSFHIVVFWPFQNVLECKNLQFPAKY